MSSKEGVCTELRLDRTEWVDGAAYCTDCGMEIHGMSEHAPPRKQDETDQTDLGPDNGIS